MTDPQVLEGCSVRSRIEGSCQAVERVSRHAAERYLERVEGASAPFSERDLRRAGLALYELFGGRTPSSTSRTSSAVHSPYNGAAAMHSGRTHVLVANGTIITLLPLGAPASGCTCKTCDRLRRRAGTKYRRSIDAGTREGMRLELAEKQPVHRKQLVHGGRNAGRSGRRAAMKDRLAIA